MKRFKKFVSIMLAAIMTLAMTLPVMAQTVDSEKGGEGSITINQTESLKLKGKTFEVYKILDLQMVGTDSDAGVSYRVPDEMADYYVSISYGTDKTANKFHQEVSDKIAALTSDKDLQTFAKNTLSWITAEGRDIQPIARGTVEGDDTSIRFENLPLGYYLVRDASAAGDTPISAVILQSTAKDVAVDIKGSQPTITKDIDAATDTDPDNGNGLVSSNNAAIGDNVPYVLSSNMPVMTGYDWYTFVVNDTLSKGLEFNDDVVITIGDGAALTRKPENATEETAYDYDVVSEKDSTTGETKVKIVFHNFINRPEAAGTPIKITYSAKINNDAVVGVAGNPNKVTLSYSNDPTKSEKPGENPDEPDEKHPTGTTPEEKTFTYVTGLKLTKISGDDEAKRLTGAEFTITGTRLNTILQRKEVFVAFDGNESQDETKYWLLKDGSYTTTDPNGTLDGATVSAGDYQDIDTIYKKTVQTTPITKSEGVEYKGTVDAQGMLQFDGLAAGDYVIKEITAPEGYNLLKDPINVTITWTAPSTIGDTANCTWAANITNTDGLTTPVAIEDGFITFNVKNNTGSLLPSTGGIGTTIFYIIGGILVVGAAILLVTKKRMSKEA